MSKKPPLDAKDVKRGLAAAGFTPRPQKGTAHEQWVNEGLDKKGQPYFFKVTVDAHLSPFSNDLVKSMAKQAGMSERQLRELCSKNGTKAAKRGLLAWLINIYS